MQLQSCAVRAGDLVAVTRAIHVSTAWVNHLR
jgi:hypothetical protein